MKLNLGKDIILEGTPKEVFEFSEIIKAKQLEETKIEKEKFNKELDKLIDELLVLGGLK